MNPASALYTVTIRKISTGHKLTAFSIASLDYARNIAQTVMNAPEWSRTYAVCLDWEGSIIFTLQPSGSREAAPLVQAYPQIQQAPQPQWVPALPHYQAPQQYAPSPQQRVQSAVVEAEFVSCPALPEYRR